ncbi:MAG: tetratricopeptide repeat protein [Syntrophomonas sp.]
MENKKSLGKGLDLLLKATSNQVKKSEDIDLNRIQLLFEQAITEDEKGQLFEAYYLFRKVIDSLESCLDLKLPGSAKLYSEACNNLAIILYESGDDQGAVKYLEQALKIWPDNSTARENLSALSK